jgi:hypothetical protein
MNGWLIMKAPSQSQLNHRGITPANLTDKQIKAVLLSFSRAKQMARVISGINRTPGMLTHTVSGEFYSNNISDIRQKAGYRLLKHGLKLTCTPQIKKNPLTKSFHWYLCRIGEIETFDVGSAANDEATS